MATLNCRPGDLAIITGAVGPIDHLIVGRIVRVTHLDTPNHDGDPCWFYEGPKITVPHPQWGSLVECSIRSLADHLLRPIRDPGDDAVDEMVRGVSCFITRTGEVTHG
jgi:hypothetical protein